jgi:hypothetical protein
MEPIVGARGMIASADVDARTAASVFELTLDLNLAANRIAALARDVPPRSAVQALAAVQALGLASTALFACLDQQCDLDQPLASMDIRPRGPDHKLIARCQHDPPHCWEGTVFIDCPPP